MNGDILETSEDGTLRLVLHIDEDSGSFSPRTDHDHIESVVTVPHSSYINVDEDGGPLADAWHHYLHRTSGYCSRGASGYGRRATYWRDAVDLFTRYARIYHGATVLVHTPHEGPVSVWYLTREVADGPDGTSDPAAYLAAQAAEYQAWAEGDVWGYVIEQQVTWYRETYDRHDRADTMTTWETTDSCWGLIGREYAEEAAREAWRAELGTTVN